MRSRHLTVSTPWGIKLHEHVLTAVNCQKRSRRVKGNIRSLLFQFAEVTVKVKETYRICQSHHLLDWWHSWQPPIREKAAHINRYWRLQWYCRSERFKPVRWGNSDQRLKLVPTWLIDFFLVEMIDSWEWFARSTLVRCYNVELLCHLALTELSVIKVRKKKSFTKTKNLIFEGSDTGSLVSYQIMVIDN